MKLFDITNMEEKMILSHNNGKNTDVSLWVRVCVCVCVCVRERVCVRQSECVCERQWVSETVFTVLFSETWGTHTVESFSLDYIWPLRGERGELVQTRVLGNNKNHVQYGVYLLSALTHLFSFIIFLIFWAQVQLLSPWHHSTGKFPFISVFSFIHSSRKRHVMLPHWHGQKTVCPPLHTHRDHPFGVTYMRFRCCTNHSHTETSYMTLSIRKKQKIETKIKEETKNIMAPTHRPLIVNDRGAQTIQKVFT